MSRARALGEHEPVTYSFTFLVAQSWIDQYIDEAGIEQSREWEIEVNLVEDVQDQETRRRFREAHEAYHNLPGYPELPEPTEDAVVFLGHLENWVVETLHSLTVEDEESQRGPFEHEMSNWISRHGSSRLQRAFERGYKTTRLYAIERGAAELPGAWIDTSNSADLRERTDPTEEALNTEDDVRVHLAANGVEAEARIMWVVSPPREADDAHTDGHVPYLADEEAVVVLDYLGRYRAIIAVDSAYRKPADEAVA